MSVIALGYLRFGVRDAQAWDRLLGGLFGLPRRPDSPSGKHLYRLDHYHHRLAMVEAPADRLQAVGWEVASREALEALAERIAASGTPVIPGAPERCRQRAVAHLYSFTAPDGVPAEIFCGPVSDVDPVCWRRGHGGYKTGALGLGHVVLAAEDAGATVDWYRNVLGFRLSDRIHWDEARATFLHCNRRHHSLAVLNTCFGLEPGQINHFMLEANCLDDVGRAYDHVREQCLPVALSLGRHSNDRMTSFYLVTPSGFWIEYGYGGVEIDGARWQPGFYDSPKIWGHAPPDA